MPQPPALVLEGGRSGRKVAALAESRRKWEAQEAASRAQAVQEAEARQAAAVAGGREELSAKTPNLSGTWLNTEIIGDAAAFLKVGCSSPPAMCKAMEAQNFGLHKFTQKIEMNPRCTRVTTTLSVAAGHPETLIIDPCRGEAKERLHPPAGDGTIHTYRCYWDEDALVTERPNVFDTRRYFVGESCHRKLYLEQYFPSKPGVTLTRVFTAQ